MSASSSRHPITPAEITWREDGTPASPLYGDVYHAADGAMGQAEHVYLAGNQLPRRWCGASRFVILETGFGLGSNFLATWLAWRDDPNRCERLVFVSFDLHPPRAADLKRSHGTAPLIEQLADSWPPLVPGMHKMEFEQGGVTLLLAFGAAHDVLPSLDLQADAIYLDGFAPARNPEMWCDDVMRQLVRLAVPGATCATYTVARSVRDAMERAGFAVQFTRGFARKPDMIVARAPEAAHVAPPEAAHAASRMQRLPTVAVVGAGLAGCATAHALAARGCKVHLIDPLGIAQATSGNRLGAVLPRVMRDDNLAARFTRAAFLRAVARVREFAPLDPDLCCLRGILHLAQDEDDEAVMQRSAQRHALDPDFAELVDVARASALAGVPVAHGGWWFPQGGWVAPARFCQALVNAHAERISTHWGVAVHALRQVHDGWQVCDAQGEVIVQADAVVLANAEDAVRFCPGLGPLQRVRGQLSEWPAMHMRAPDIPVTGDGYVMPARDGMVLVGATYELDDDPSPALRTDAHRLNAERVQRLLPSHPALHDGARMEVDVHADMPGRVGWRVVANDRLPLIGLVQRGQAESDKAESDKAGLYVVTGLASRGITWSVLAGEIVCAQLCGDPLPIERALLQAVAPTRFAERRARRGNAIMSP